MQVLSSCLLFGYLLCESELVQLSHNEIHDSVQIIDLLAQSLGTFVHRLLQFQENDCGMEATVNICASVGLSISTQTKRKKQQNISESRSPSSCLIMREMLNYVRCMKCTSVNSLSGVTFIDLICSCYWVELSH